MAGGIASQVGGCGGLADVDSATDRLIADRTSALMGASLRPALSGVSDGYVKTTGLDSGTVANRTPATNDPAASALTLTPADEARDTAARLAAYGSSEQNGTPLDLPGALTIGQRSGREFLTAQEDYFVAAINLLLERHLWGPRFFATTDASTTATGDDGDFTAPLNLINQLRAVQRLPNGGQVEARFLWNATQQLTDAATDRYTQASSLVLSASIPLLRGAGLAASEDLTQAERDLVYAARAFESFRRGYLVSLSRDYFDLLQQQRTIENQERALELLKNLEKRTTALVEAGRLAEFQKNIAANDVLRATSQLASQRERFILALDRFKVRLGLDVNAPIIIKGDVPVIPEPDTTPQAAASAALDYRLDLQTARDRVEDAKRRVLVADNATLADVELFGSADFRTDPDRSVGRARFETEDSAYTAGVRADWPIDRRSERLSLRVAQINAQRAQRDADVQRDNVVIESRAAAREIDRARFALTLAEEAVRINQRRAKEQELKADEVTAQEIVDTANALRDAENSRDQALTDLRNAVLDYLLATGQLRVTRQGLLQLPGQ